MGIRWVRAAYMGKIIVWLTTSVLSLFDPKSPGAREKTDAIGGEFTERNARPIDVFHQSNETERKTWTLQITRSIST
jgi:hypothetical protein